MDALGTKKQLIWKLLYIQHLEFRSDYFGILDSSAIIFERSGPGGQLDHGSVSLTSRKNLFSLTPETGMINHRQLAVQ